ncbi:conserved hypothetical protein [Ricinus communis]|uniref:Uncharacterized protein n=1 Tax=Ricinus communis TaxID=3988 RepID=B9RVM4_RICCO|nr:conserved hypothetical protein [Ricinus communis]
MEGAVVTKQHQWLCNYHPALHLQGAKKPDCSVFSSETLVQIVQGASVFLNQLNLANQLQPTQVQRVQDREVQNWQRFEAGCIACFIVRDDAGMILAARNSQVEDDHVTPAAVEAMGLREAMSWLR